MTQALYRKWRPASFDDVVGQEHVTTTLKNQITGGRIGHAYLFSGSRGCGKTTSARIFAKEINIAGMDPASAQAKRIAEGVAEGRALDIIEIDAASHTGVDDIRELRDKVAFQPTELRYKVYIIDEVHMLSISAFNALLKTLEEPPPHVVFILATTDPQKIPATVLSRCQRFNFRRVPINLIVGRLRTLCAGEGIDADDHALTLVARHASGSLRDAISLLDQLASSNSQRITAGDVRDLLGATDAATVRRLIDGLLSGDIAGGLDAIQLAVDQGADARQLARQTVDMLRGVLQLKFAGAGRSGRAQARAAKPAGDLSEAELAELGALAEQAATPALLRGVRAFSTALADMRNNPDAQLALEMAYLECAAPVEAPGEVAAPHAEPRPATRGAAREERPAPSATRPPAHAEPASEAAAAAIPPSSSAAVASAPATSSGAAFQTLKAEWKQVVALVNRSNKAAAAVLRSVEPYAVVGDVVQLKAEHDFHRTQIDNAKNKPLIASAINQVLGGKFGVQVFTGQVAAAPDANDDPVLRAAQKLGGVIRE